VATLIMSCAVSATNHVNCPNCTTTLSPATGHPEQPLHHENADAIVAALAIALMFVVTSCSDRIRGECITKPEAPRCDTSTGATTP
jgi:hypothetical protein